MKDLTKGKPSTLILSFALPVFLGNLLQLTYSLADTRIVGSFLKEDALAAVGATSPLSGLIIGFLMGLANGFAIVTAQKFGAGNREEVRKSFALSLVMGSVISLILTVLGLLFLHPPCTCVLAAEDRHGLAEHAKHDHKHLCDLTSCCMCHNDISSQPIDGGLKCQCTKIYKRAYKSHRKSGTQHIFHHISFETEKILFFQP